MQEVVSLVPAIDLSTVHPHWSKVCQSLIEHIGLPKFNSWIAILIPEGLDTPTPILKAPTSFIKAWVERNYLELIREAFKQVGSHIEEISIIHLPGEAA